MVIASEVGATVARGGVEAPAERAVHGLGRSEAAGLGDLFDGGLIGSYLWGLWLVVLGVLLLRRLNGGVR